MDWYTTIYEMGDADIYCGRSPEGSVAKPPEKGWLGNPVKKNQGCPRCEELHIGSGSTLDCFEDYLREKLKSDEIFSMYFDGATEMVIGEDVRLACFCDDPNTCHTSILYKHMRLHAEGKLTLSHI